MKKFNKKLAVMILKNTTAYELNQIGFTTMVSDQLTIWSLNGGENFHATGLIQLFAHPFSSYVKYNHEYNRCELVIF